MSARRLSVFAVALFLCAAPRLFGERPIEGARAFDRPVVSRLLGPISELAAEVQWVRVQAAMSEGRSELALARAETALGLDPSSTEGWRFAAAYLALELGSPNTEPRPARRRALIRSALELLSRGEASARAPEQLALWRGFILSTHAEVDPELDWPTGARGLWNEAAQAFESAAELGSSDGEALARMARARAQLERPEAR